MENIYFDNAATTKLDEKVLDAMLPYLKENYGNASSIYKLGREARKAIEETREKVAKILNCKPSEVYFTAGGSESVPPPARPRKPPAGPIARRARPGRAAGHT